MASREGHNAFALRVNELRLHVNEPRLRLNQPTNHVGGSFTRKPTNHPITYHKYSFVYA